MTIDDDETIREFLVESHEGLDQLDREFVALEESPGSKERIATIFRAIHTIKGTSGFLALPKLEALAHAGEGLLALVREGTLTMTPDITSALLTLVDRIRAALRSIEATGTEGDATHEDLVERLHALRTGSAPAPRAEAPAALPPPPPPPAPPPPPPAAAPVARKVAAQKPSSPPPDAAASPAGPQVADSNVRVDVELLDKLMNLVGELVLARNQIVQFGARIEEHGFVGASQRLNHITTELQEQVMKTRMQPIGNVWGKLPRVVRDLAITLGKQVRVEMHGKETELDRTILEAIKDPLTHIVRNAVDHGLESPDVRAARGKGRTGSLVLRAFHGGGQVNIEISDDGAGLDLDAIRKKAIERDLVTAERAPHLSDYETSQLVFVAGFSTAERVTNVSGRGVGMDVVKTNIERIGGTVDLHSHGGQGTTIKIRIPLTLAIVPALIVASAGQRYAIPQANLLELVHLDGGIAASAIETIHGAPVYRLRGQLLPIVHLSRALGLADAVAGADVNIVVVQADDRAIGLIVDEVNDTEEIVVKPLGKELKGLSVFAGATIMGDGRVALIIDVAGLAVHAGVISRARDGSAVRTSKDKSGSVISEVAEKQAFLIFGVGGERRMAVALAQVARLEEFSRSRFERAGGIQVVQYRGQILPIIDLSAMDGKPRADVSDALPAIVYSEGSRSIGFVVDSILDVVEECVQIERCTTSAGVLGAGLIQGKVTDLLDVRGLIQQQAPWFFEESAA